MLSITQSAFAQGESFSQLVGNVNVGEVQNNGTINVPFIVWGGEYPTFYANGGLQTQQGTLYNDLGVNINMTPGDDFVQQVRDYMSGKSPFLRGTMRMVSMASEVINNDPRTEGVVLLQMTWSQGDHVVARQAALSNINGLKGTTGVIQRGGPHVGLVEDMLNAAQLTWDDINVVWVDNLTGPNSPAEKFRDDPNIDWCTVITPDMFGLTGGFDSTGNGVEGTIRGARVILSTQELSRSVADVYLVRSDFLANNYDWCMNFAAGYLKAVEEVIDHRNAWESRGSQEYEELLEMAQKIYGTDVLPTIEEDAHGLLADCTFVGHPGNVAFFTEENNPNGFDAFATNGIAMSQNLGILSRGRLKPSTLDWGSASFTGYLAKTGAVRQERFNPEAVLAEIEALNTGALDARTRLSFEITFAENQQAFSAAQYSDDFDRVIENASKFGNAAIIIQGHSDPTRTLLEIVRAGMDSGVITRTGTSGNWVYKIQGRTLDLTDTQKLVDLVDQGVFDRSASYDPRRYYNAAQDLSRKRAEAVRDSIIAYASNRGITIDPSQIQPQGVGITDPVVAKPTNLQEAASNRRVEFRLVKVSPETMNSSDFDF